jgi:hypothetical protein
MEHTCLYCGDPCDCGSVLDCNCMSCSFCISDGYDEYDDDFWGYDPLDEDDDDDWP